MTTSDFVDRMDRAAEGVWNDMGIQSWDEWYPLLIAKKGDRCGVDVMEPLGNSEALRSVFYNAGISYAKRGVEADSICLIIVGNGKEGPGLYTMGHNVNERMATIFYRAIEDGELGPTQVAAMGMPHAIYFFWIGYFQETHHQFN